MMCSNPITLTKNIDRRVYPDGLTVPCGRCLNCRIQYRQVWAMRVLHEADYWKDKSFITLTYSEENLPETGSISKTELQKFFKRLRKRLSPIKYFACGEYGSCTGRPHYHAILLGCGLNKIHKQYVKESWPYCDWSIPTFDKACFGMVEPHSIQYVTQYIDKKYSGGLADEVYTSKGLEIPFRLLSHGIGKAYAQDHKEQLRERGFITIRGSRRSIPRYYMDKAEFSDEERSRLSEYAQEQEIKFVEDLTGLSYSRADAYRILDVDDIILIEDTHRSRCAQLEKNRQAQSALKLRKL